MPISQTGSGINREGKSLTAPIRVGLVGYGLAGKVFHAPLIRATTGFELAVVVSSRVDEVRARLPDAAIVQQIGDVLTDPSIGLVVIATPDHLHKPHVLAALAAGKHVVVDKPFAPNLSEAQEMAARAAQAGTQLFVFHNRRWDADFLTLRKLIDAGELGEIRQFESHFDRYRPAVGERWKDTRPGGVWQDLGPHLVDQAIQLFGMPAAVLADLASQRQDGGSCDYAHVLLDHGNVRSILHITQSAPAHSLRFAVHGSRGSYIKHGLDPQEDQSKSGLCPGNPGWAIDLREGELTRGMPDGSTRPQAIPNLPGDYLAFYRGVCASIRGFGANPVPADQALQVMAVIDAGTQSARTRSWTVPKPVCSDAMKEAMPAA
jgi:predicted dehydrogenase